MSTNWLPNDQIRSYHDQLGGGELPNGWWAHGEYGNNESGTYLHYLIIFQRDDGHGNSVHVLYHLEGPPGEKKWVRKHRMLIGDIEEA